MGHGMRSHRPVAKIPSATLMSPNLPTTRRRGVEGKAQPLCVPLMPKWCLSQRLMLASSLLRRLITGLGSLMALDGPHGTGKNAEKDAGHGVLKMTQRRTRVLTQRFNGRSSSTMRKWFLKKSWVGCSYVSLGYRQARVWRYNL